MVGRRVRMLLSFQRPSHLSRRVILRSGTPGNRSDPRGGLISIAREATQRKCRLPSRMCRVAGPQHSRPGGPATRRRRPSPPRTSLHGSLARSGAWGATRSRRRGMCAEGRCSLTCENPRSARQRCRAGPGADRVWPRWPEDDQLRDSHSVLAWAVVPPTLASIPRGLQRRKPLA
jgi:hypothetical protein